MKKQKLKPISKMSFIAASCTSCTIRWVLFFSFIFVFIKSVPEAQAGAFELAMGFSFNRNHYSESNFVWSRRWVGSFGYYFSERSQIEFSIQDVVERTKIGNYGDITLQDKIYSISWIQALLGKGAVVEPFFKLGVGQLNRDSSGKYADGSSPPVRVDSVTGVAGAGAKVHIMRTLALRVEAVSYLVGGKIQKWKDDIIFNFGTSFFF